MTKEMILDWVFILIVCLCISWVGALIGWLIPSYSTLTPIQIGSGFSYMSLIGCGIGLLLSRGDC